ncbi:MAG: phosphoribosylglycinamide formyltransferase [Prevotellaceae bacterium]|jgi:phosphoribosylglycinamide formyltransferase-1|nr:phosphoribosylglycinamide formyltransferase [Prevotellaceae bacterium]
MINLAIFASGTGSNAENLIRHFEKHEHIRIGLVLCNCAGAPVLKRVKKLGVPTHVFNKADFYRSDAVLKKLQEYHIQYIVLAGFLWLMPENLLAAFPQRIINIHPALLPKYGGKGMYGIHVHRAVIANAEKETGITIHQVDAEYDHGKILFQAQCAVDSNDTPESIVAKVHALEYWYFPEIVEKWIGF